MHIAVVVRFDDRRFTKTAVGYLEWFSPNSLAGGAAVINLVAASIRLPPYAVQNIVIIHIDVHEVPGVRPVGHHPPIAPFAVDAVHVVDVPQQAGE